MNEENKKALETMMKITNHRNEKLNELKKDLNVNTKILLDCCYPKFDEIIQDAILLYPALENYSKNFSQAFKLYDTGMFTFYIRYPWNVEHKIPWIFMVDNETRKEYSLKNYKKTLGEVIKDEDKLGAIMYLLKDRDKAINNLITSIKLALDIYYDFSKLTLEDAIITYKEWTHELN